MAETGKLRILLLSADDASSHRRRWRGLAVLEAIACGCVPVAPDRLVYPEYIPDVPDTESSAVADHLQSLYNRYRQGELPAALVAGYLSWGRLVSAYGAEIDGLA